MDVCGCVSFGDRDDDVSNVTRVGLKVMGLRDDENYSSLGFGSVMKAFWPRMLMKEYCRKRRENSQP